MGKKFDEFLQNIGQEVGAAITDIREKVVEEPWWGRSLGDSHAPAETTAPATNSPFHDYAREAAAHEARNEREPQEPGHDR